GIGQKGSAWFLLDRILSRLGNRSHNATREQPNGAILAEQRIRVSEAVAPIAHRWRRGRSWPPRTMGNFRACRASVNILYYTK
ncbi:hypothetical protein, partial [uncultured Rhodoblastus sp.]|uniref:hypothetical protein n=1 Tax=uncultured Rhodoblastus sp. TaxID=543037 RepID=UPI0025D88389